MALFTLVEGHPQPWTPRLQPDAPWIRGPEAVTAMHRRERAPHSVITGDDHQRKAQSYAVRDAAAKLDTSESPALTVGQLMTSPALTLREDDTLASAQSTFVNRRIRHLPIESGGAIVGILSDRDCLRASAARADVWGTPVRQWMTREPVVATPDTVLIDAARALLEHRIHALPVVELPGNRICGILTTTDILRGIAQYRPLSLWA